MALFCYFEWNYDNDEGEGWYMVPNLGIPEREFRLKIGPILTGIFSSVTRQKS